MCVRFVAIRHWQLPHERFECCAVLLGQRSLFHRRVYDQVRGFAFGQNRPIVLAHDGIAEVNQRTADIAQLRSDDDLFIVVGRRFVSTARIDYRQMTVGFEFHLLVYKSQTAHELYASDLHPDEEVRVIHNAHLVGFGVADANAHFMSFGRGWTRQCPLHCGLRFSRNAVMPSRKSCVWRMRAFSAIEVSIRRSSSSLTFSDRSCLVARKEAALFSIRVCASSCALASR